MIQQGLPGGFVSRRHKLNQILQLRVGTCGWWHLTRIPWCGEYVQFSPILLRIPANCASLLVPILALRRWRWERARKILCRAWPLLASAVAWLGDDSFQTSNRRA